MSTVRGALLGVAAGDALGWPQELRGGLVGGQPARDRAEPTPAFRRWTRHAGHYTRRYDDWVLPGEYSDDTQLMLSVARACMTGDRWLDHLTGVELPAWPIYQRGGGGAVLSAANSWAAGDAPWQRGGSARSEKAWNRYVGAGANGVAMRIAPHVIVATSYDDLIDRVFRDGITTHGHPRALVGAVTYAVTLRCAFDTDGQLKFGDLLDAARDGLVSPDRVMHLLPHDWGDARAVEQFAESWQTTNCEMAQLVDQIATSLREGAMSNATSTLEELGCTNPKVNGAGTVTAAAAVYAASRFAARPMHGLLSTTFLRKGDTDTLGSMTGALLGALHGESWLGDLGTSVQDAGYLAEVAEVLANRDRYGTTTTHAGEATALRKEWRRVTAAANPPIEGTFPDGRRYRIIEIEQIRDDVRRIRIRLEGGQTAMVDTPAPRANPTATLPAPDRPSIRQGVHGTPQSGALGLLTAVTAFTPDLNRATAFYARLLGRDIDTRLDEVRITDWFVLRRLASPTEATAGAGIGLMVTVDDLHAAAQRVGADLPAPGARHFNTRDPDGRYVRVERAATDDPTL